MQAAVNFLEINGIDTTHLPEQRTYDAMMKAAGHKMDRSGLGEYFRSTLSKGRSVQSSDEGDPGKDQ